MNKSLLIFLMCTCQLMLAQVAQPVVKGCAEVSMPKRDYNDPNLVFNLTELDEKPEFPVGNSSMFQYIGQNFKMPAATLKGRIFANFIVEKDGAITGVRILRDAGPGTADEAIRTLNAMPKWKPGKWKGKTVRCAYSLPFKIPYDPASVPSNKIKIIKDKY